MRTRKVILVAMVLASLGSFARGADPKPDQAALERTRKQVRMLDDLYKTAVVLITETYVKKETDVSAATAAMAIFQAMEKNRWHEIHLIDLTGSPYDEKNVAKDEFEKRAAKVLASGKETYVEEVEAKDGTQYLRAATAIPVVHKKCAMCHPNFSDVKKDQAVGALTYKLKIE